VALGSLEAYATFMRLSQDDGLMRYRWRAVFAIAAVALSVGAAPARPGSTGEPSSVSSHSPDAENEIVVTGYQDIVVNGRAIRCRPAVGDPFDGVDLSSAFDTDPHSGLPLPKHMVIIPDGRNGFVAAPNAEQITGPDFWQRVGVRMDQYVFRAPSSQRPMCIGGGGDVGSFAGFRRVVDAAQYRGHRLRFTAWVATGRAEQVSFWLAAGTEWPERRREFEVRRTAYFQLLNGGNTNNVRFGGNHAWTPVLLETGPIHKDAHHVSYGFNIQGSGDVWVYDPKLEIVPGAPADPRPNELVVMIGRERGQDP
jgi:hypothetical protein